MTYTFEQLKDDVRKEAEASIAFDKAIDEFFAKELAKPQPRVCYLPSAKRPAESLVGPLIQ